MGFFALASMKGKCRNRLDAKYPMRLVLSNVKPRFKYFVEAKKIFFVLRYSFFYSCLLLLSLVGSRLFLQIKLFNEF